MNNKPTNERIIKVIYTAIKEENVMLPPERQLTPSTETILYGREGKLDSLGLVNLIVSTEQKIEEDFGVSITLADEKAMAERTSPFRTVQTLADYIARLLGETALDSN